MLFLARMRWDYWRVLPAFQERRSITDKISGYNLVQSQRHVNWYKTSPPQLILAKLKTSKKPLSNNVNCLKVKKQKG